MTNRYTLDNGLRIVHCEDTTTQMVAVNVLYDVGARDEAPERTGYAHLLEHLMFEGSINISDYDTHVQMAGGENNAWTNNDLTNYYITVPRSNVETAFWSFLCLPVSLEWLFPALLWWLYLVPYSSPPLPLWG